MSLVVVLALSKDLRSSLVRLVRGDSVGSVFPAGNFVAPPTNLVAKGLHRQNCEGFFHLRGQFFNAKKQDAQHRHGRKQADVVPHISKRFPQSEGHQEQPEGQKPGCVAVVDKRDRRGQQSLARAKIVLEDSQCSVHLVLSEHVHGQVLDSQTQVVKRSVRAMSGLNDRRGLPLRQPLVQFGLEVGLVFRFRAQMSLHRSDKRPSAEADSLEVCLSLLVRDARAVVVGVRHSVQVAGVVDVLSPVLSGFVPTLVCRV